jgi:hypothetical protein
LLHQFNIFFLLEVHQQGRSGFSAQGSEPALIIWEGIVDSAFWSPTVGIFVVISAFAFTFIFSIARSAAAARDGHCFGRSSPA